MEKEPFRKGDGGKSHPQVGYGLSVERTPTAAELNTPTFLLPKA